MLTYSFFVRRLFFILSFLFIFLFYFSAWNDDDFPTAKKTEMLAIKASSSYMGNAGGEGAIWQRTPTGTELKVKIESMQICKTS